MTTIEVRTNGARDGGGRTQWEARRVTWVGLGVNLLLCAVKLVCGLAAASQALVADAVHTLSDSTTDVAVLVGIPFWSAPADDRHPYGHRRIETVVTVLIAAVLVVVACGLVYHALATIEEHHDRPPELLALLAAVLSILSKETLYRWTVAVGRRLRSSALIANAWHHRSDSFSSIPVVLAIGGARLFPAWSFLDHIGAVVVSIFIFRAAWQIGWPALRELMDAGAPGKDRRRIEEIVLATAGVERVHEVRTRYVGSRLQVDLHIMVDGNMTVREGHKISEAVEERLLAAGPDLVDVVVHLEPVEPEDEELTTDGHG